MEAKEIMQEDCANWLECATMTYGLPPREGAFIKFAKLCAEAILRGEKVATQDELCEYFRGLHWYDPNDCKVYADVYGWLMRAFLYQLGRIDIPPFTIEQVDY